MEPLNSISWTSTRQQLKAFVNRRVHDRAAADDIVHEVFLKVHAGIRQLKSQDRLNGWIFRITRNAIVDHFRRERKLLAATDNPVILEEEENDFNACVAGCLQEELKTMPPIYREALVLAEMSDLSQTELASKLSISYSGAKSRVQRARKMLKDRMEEKYSIQTDHYGNVIVCEDRIACDCNKTDTHSK